MTFLQAIWWISLFMALLSVLIMTGLILRRWVIQSRQAWWLKRKEELTAVVFEHMGKPDTHSVLKEKMSGKDLRLIQEIIHELIEVVGGETETDLLELLNEIGGFDAALQDVKSKNERQRMKAVGVLSLFNNDPQAIEALRSVLDDPFPRIRRTAADALVDMGAEIPIGELIEKLDVENDIRPRLLREVFRKIAPRSVPEMIDILKSNASPAVRELIINALGDANDYSVVEVLNDEMKSPVINIRAEVLRSLATIGHPSAQSAVLLGLRDDAWEVRTQAAICAGRIGLSEALPDLIRLLNDPQWWVRFRAARALKKIGGEGIRQLEKISAGTTPAAKISTLVLAEGKTA